MKDGVPISAIAQGNPAPTELVDVVHTHTVNAH